MMQLQQQHAPRCVHFRPPFAAISSADFTGSTAGKRSWGQPASPQLTVNFSGTWIKVCIPQILPVNTLWIYKNDTFTGHIAKLLTHLGDIFSHIN
jgi:hypothetical protein